MSTSTLDPAAFRVDDLKRQEGLIKTGALQSAILHRANFSSIATDEKGVIQLFNVGAERMLGYAAADVVDKITPADISDSNELITRAEELSRELGTTITPGFQSLAFKASRGIEDIYELTYIRKDGSRFPAVVSVTALRDARSGITMVFPRFDVPLFVRVDRIRMKEVLINLLSNAIKYNQMDGNVVVDCSVTSSGRIRVRIKDTGAGLPPEKLAQLFQSFNRLGQEGGAEEGTGIGLVVSKRLVELMDGSIGAESTVGEGSVFWIELTQEVGPMRAPAPNQ